MDNYEDFRRLCEVHCGNNEYMTNAMKNARRIWKNRVSKFFQGQFCGYVCSRSRELLACQKFMTILMGHKAVCVAKQHMQLRKSAVDFSQLLTLEVEGCLNFSDFFFFVFLGLRIFT